MNEHLEVDPGKFLENRHPIRVGEVEVDARRRVSLGSFATENSSRYRAFERPEGQILLVPVISVPVGSHAYDVLVEQGLLPAGEANTS